VALLDVLIVGLMAASAYVVYRGLWADRLRLRVWGCGEEIVVEGRRMEPLVLSIESDEAVSEAKAARIAEILRGSGVSSIVVVSYLAIDKHEALARIEDEIKSVEFKFNATRMPRYKARLDFLRHLYLRVSRAYTPVASTLHIVVLVDEGSRGIVDTIKRSIEAELGVSVKVSSFKGLAHMISSAHPTLGAPHSPSPPAEPEVAPARVIVGYRRGGGLASLRWPHDFEAHVGVFGPTGRGKSVLLAGLSTQLASTERGPYSVAVVDPKGDLASMLKPVADRVVEVEGSEEIPAPAGPRGSCRGTPLTGGLEVFDISQAPEKEKSVVAERLLEAIVDHALSGTLPGRVVVVVDEAWRIGGSEKLLRLIAREGRSRGLHLIYASQHPNDMSRDILANTRTIIVFGGSERSYLEAVLGIGVPSSAVDELPRLGRGEAVIKVGSGRLEFVRVLGFHEYLNRPGWDALETGRGEASWVKG
jgi:hypothetical protein